MRSKKNELAQFQKTMHKWGKEFITDLKRIFDKLDWVPPVPEIKIKYRRLRGKMKP